MYKNELKVVNPVCNTRLSLRLIMPGNSLFWQYLPSKTMPMAILISRVNT